MKFQFDSNLPHQQRAISAVVDLFEGYRSGPVDVASTMQIFDTELFHGSIQTEHGLGNASLPVDGLLKRIQAIQKRNDLEPSTGLGVRYGDEVSEKCLHFSIEMETGTGKTYVYLRTLFELHQKHGLSKFIIVVPSVAIREGTLKTLEMTREHFRSLYNQVPYDYFVYDSKKPSKIRQFASSNQLQIMVINIQAFQGAGDTRVFSQAIEKLNGNRPADFVASTKPVVIIDEPQSVDNTDAAKKAILSLNPLCTLRYSATHKNPYHLLYRLGPVEAFDQQLVKGIEVDSVVMTGAASSADPYLHLSKIELKDGGASIRAKVKLHKRGASNASLVTVKNNDDLFKKSGNNEGFSGDWIVTEINATPGSEYLEFANGRVIRLGEEFGGSNENTLRQQIHDTVRNHCERLNQLAPRGVKVLSLFFLDRVANYKSFTEEGRPVKEKFARWFEEAYEELRGHKVFGKHLKYPAEDVHDGYFSGDKKGWQDTSGVTAKDRDTYELIMKDKERLLSPDEPVQFLFSHSALREGWDNPNVFQICTLREMGTDTERRQTLGRGLRLARDAEGKIIDDPQVNRLTVICNERFDDYARGLQADIADATGIEFGIIKPEDFRNLTRDGEESEIGKTQSAELWAELKEAGYLTARGELTDQFSPEAEGFILDTSDRFRSLRPQIIDLLRASSFTSRIRQKRQRTTIRLNKQVQLTPEFEELWRRISRKTRYAVEFETSDLIVDSVRALDEMPDIPTITISSTKEQLQVSKAGLRGRTVRAATVETVKSERLPDLLTHLQVETRLTRNTLSRILIQSKRLSDFLKNPSVFSKESARAINLALARIVDDGVTYHQLEDITYEQRLFDHDDAREITAYASRLYEVQNKEKCLYNAVEWESDVEKEFAQELDDRSEVKLFFKLPRWFRIPTPVGAYNPDWAIVAGGEERVYLVRETKSTRHSDERRDSENRKIKFGKRHFEALSTKKSDEVDFRDCVTLSQALDGIV